MIIKHTPGPWQVCDDLCSVKGQPQGKPYTVTVAECPGYKTEREANARLIAAAPEMLEALRKATLDLEDVVQHLDPKFQLRLNIESAITQARAIIAKLED